MSSAGPVAIPMAMASLYVGDLHQTVTESQLFEKFSQIGPVLSIRVCRDAVTRRSLGYAYVNFQQPEHAKTAIDSMNFDPMNGKPMRIMWSNRDPATRRSGVGNIYIKNLDGSIDNKALYDTFSLFGKILSCKVATDDEGKSKGYGFVHFEDEAEATRAIDKVNGMMLVGKLVYVGKFKPRTARMRELGESPHAFTNVFVKNFGKSLDKDGLEKLFEKFGKIVSCVVMTGSDDKPKGFGFVCFEKPDQAQKAVEEMDGHVLEGTEDKLTVCRAQTKGERQAELKMRYEQFKIESIQRYQGVNLYVKNLDDAMDDEALQKLFTEFGTVTSAKVMLDEDKRSKGFGFVCFDRPEEATKAHAALNGKMLSTKPLYVAFAQRKEDRRAYLASQYMQRLATTRYNQGVPGMTPGTMFAPATGGYFVNPMPAPRNNYLGHTIPVSTAALSRYGGQHMQQQQRQVPPYAAPRQPGARQPGQQNGPRRPGPAPPRGPQQKTQQQTQPASESQNVPQSGPLTPAMLAQATPQQQKQMLGEHIYEKIMQMANVKQGDVGKITGMVLEIENSELLMILNDEELFSQRIAEAANVLANAVKN